MIRMLGGPLCPKVYAPLLSGQVSPADCQLVGPDAHGHWYLAASHDDVRQARALLLEGLNRTLAACIEAVGTS